MPIQDDDFKADRERAEAAMREPVDEVTILDKDLTEDVGVALGVNFPDMQIRINGLLDSAGWQQQLPQGINEARIMELQEIVKNGIVARVELYDARAIGNIDKFKAAKHCAEAIKATMQFAVNNQEFMQSLHTLKENRHSENISQSEQLLGGIGFDFEFMIDKLAERLDVKNKKGLEAQKDILIAIDKLLFGLIEAPTPIPDELVEMLDTKVGGGFETKEAYYAKEKADLDKTSIEKSGLFEKIKDFLGGLIPIKFADMAAGADQTKEDVVMLDDITAPQAEGGIEDVHSQPAGRYTEFVKEEGSQEEKYSPVEVDPVGKPVKPVTYTAPRATDIVPGKQQPAGVGSSTERAPAAPGRSGTGPAEGTDGKLPEPPPSKVKR